MIRPILSGMAIAASLLLPIAPTWADGDPVRGEALFGACQFCHTLTPDGGYRAGPTLYGLFGRKAGSVEGYAYSPALAQSDIVWTAETVDRLFAEGPHLYTPGSKMPLQQLPSDQDRADLIAFLMGFSDPASP